MLPCGEPAAGLHCSNPSAGPSGPVGFLKRVQRYALSKSPPNFFDNFFSKKFRSARKSSENPPENRHQKTRNRTREPQRFPAMTQDKTRAEARSTDKFAGADGDCRTSPLWKGLPDFIVATGIAGLHHYGKDCRISPLQRRKRTTRKAKRDNIAAYRIKAV